MIAFVANLGAICGTMHAIPGEEEARIVVLETEIGGERFVDELEDDPLSRIC